MAGRDVERAELVRHLDAALSGTGGVILVRGVFPDRAAPHRGGAAWSLYAILTSPPGRASRPAAEPLVRAARLASISRVLCIGN
jgi:hypothetical protein